MNGRNRFNRIKMPAILNTKSTTCLQQLTIYKNQTPQQAKAGNELHSCNINKFVISNMAANKKCDMNVFLMDKTTPTICRPTILCVYKFIFSETI